MNAVRILPLLLLSVPLVAEEEYDAVAEGKRLFEGLGCMECHVVAKDDVSLKTGPSLYGLFLNEPREREVGVVGSDERRQSKADKAYFENSVRKSWDELAVAEAGPTKGQVYLPIMPMFTPEVLPDEGMEAIWHYLRTLAEEGEAGPATVMLKRAEKAPVASHLEIPGEEVVGGRVRVMRAPLRGSSGRAVHVGQPNGISYTFDPRMLAVRRVWSGGYLNLKEERSGRGNEPSRVGEGASVFLEGAGVLVPLTAAGEAVDFEFKEPDVRDHAAIARHLWDEVDFGDKLSGLDAEYLGHRLATENGAPEFRFRVGRNRLAESIALTDDAWIEIALDGALRDEQRFRLPVEMRERVEITGGVLQEGVWVLPAGEGRQQFRLRAKLSGGVVARPKLERDEDWGPQALVVVPEGTDGRRTDLPPGYTIETWQPPLDLFGRKQLFEPTGMAVAEDGTLVVVTRTAGIWRLQEGRWSLFAEGIYEGLGVWIEDEKGDRIVIAQKPELTRISDGDGDGRAEVFDTVCDDYGFHANYHEYTHGPVRDAEGNYYFTLNLSHGGDERTSWRAGGPYMGSMGGYRGWACRVTPEGKFEPFANGLRSPAGLGFDPAGRLWYAENQGEYVGSSKMVPLEEGKFYGHLSGLVTLPGMKPDSEELRFEHWREKIRKGAVWIPHGKLANSPGNPAWDLTGGKFGPFGGQMFIGDQTLSTLLRVVTEQVNGADQGSVTVFGRNLASGVMRPCFLPDGSLLVGQTGRGWNANGGNQFALQRIVWDGRTVAAEISRVGADAHGLEVHFTRPLAEEVTEEALREALRVRSWFYTNTPQYGSPEHDQRAETVEGATLSKDRSSVRVGLKGFGNGDGWVDRIYHLDLPETGKLFGEAPVRESLEAYFTLRAIPGAE